MRELPGGWQRQEDVAWPRSPGQQPVRKFGENQTEEMDDHHGAGRNQRLVIVNFVEPPLDDVATIRRTIVVLVGGGLFLLTTGKKSEPGKGFDPAMRGHRRPQERQHEGNPGSVSRHGVWDSTAMDFVQP